jgi:hypothetical protein
MNVVVGRRYGIYRADVGPRIHVTEDIMHGDPDSG